jgi:hypothetical protein
MNRGAYNQIVGLEDTINAGFRDKIVMGIRDIPVQIPGRQVGMLQCHIDDQLSDRVRNPVPLLADSCGFDSPLCPDLAVRRPVTNGRNCCG